ncbi:TspO/MBR family protein [uncultured Amnibacterium sp.]|uniref:TspO/MBR family protein n=1 Tax=uncultured Amnibacterium sp. TaxID=1631851 RepID=UPI0035CA3CEA
MSYAQTESHPRSTGTILLLPFLAIAAALSALGLLSTTSLVSSWFTSSPRADWTPHLSVFTAVWTLVYCADALAGWLLLRARRTSSASGAPLIAYWVQLVLQAVWLLAFMAQAAVGGTWLWAVFGVIVLLDVVTAAAAISAWRVSRAASVLLVAVLAWLLFGTVLSGADTLLQVGLP